MLGRKKSDLAKTYCMKAYTIFAHGKFPSGILNRNHQLFTRRDISTLDGIRVADLKESKGIPHRSHCIRRKPWSSFVHTRSRNLWRNSKPILTTKMRGGYQETHSIKSSVKTYGGLEEKSQTAKMQKIKLAEPESVVLDLTGHKSRLNNFLKFSRVRSSGICQSGRGLCKRMRDRDLSIEKNK